ncbi:MAG: phage major capsid protein, partial [Clostridiales bacterium]|nr:phage major capsid protein [Clostridiales bacterium]
MVSLETAEKALKSFYLGVVSEQLNFGVNPFLAKIQQTSSDVFGKEVVKLISYGINGGVGAGKETGDLPAASGNNYAQLRTDLKNLYGSIEISDKAMRASENAAGAFVNLLNAEMDGLLKASKYNFGRMIFGDGTGVLANVVSTDSTDRKKITVNDTKYLIEGMILDIVDSATGTVTIPRTKILKINRTDKIVFVDINPAALSASCRLVSQSSYNQELTGLKSVFGASASLYGLTRADNAWLNPNNIDAGGEDVSSALIQRAIDDTEALNGGGADIIISSYGVKRAMINYLSYNRLNLDYMNLDGGYKAL